MHLPPSSDIFSVCIYPHPLRTSSLCGKIKHCIFSTLFRASCVHYSHTFSQLSLSQVGQSDESFPNLVSRQRCMTRKDFLYHQIQSTAVADNHITKSCNLFYKLKIHFITLARFLTFTFPTERLFQYSLLRQLETF